MDKHHIGFLLLQYRADPLKNVDRNVKQGLFFLHDGQIVLRCDMERVKNLIEHLTVLSGDTDDGLHSGTFFQCIDKRTHFDRFRSRTEYEHDFFHGCWLLHSIHKSNFCTL